MRLSASRSLLLPLLTATLVLEGCGTTTAVHRKESFQQTDMPYSAKISRPSKIVCWSVYATAMREVNKVQRENQHRSVGVGWATITVPAGSAKILRPLSRETVSDPAFYQRFYALVSRLAEEDARKGGK